MRPVVLGLILAAAALPASAQVNSFELDALRAQQEAAQRRAIDLDNQLQAMDARRRADQAASATEPRRGAVRLWVPPYPLANAPQADAPPPSYPSMSDAALADSNRRVQEAARNRR